MPRKLLLRPLSIPEILRWADAYRELAGKWPTKTSGTITASKFESWHRVDTALRNGLRGLPGGSSLAQLLSEHRGVRNVHGLSPLSEEQILAWADLHYERTKTWPAKSSGTIPNTGRESWFAIDMALRAGARGLAGGSSLARLLAKHRGVRNRKGLPPFTEEEVLRWADAYFKRNGTWPIAKSGSIADASGETWLAVDMALRKGLRGLPGGSSLAFLLADKRNVRNAVSLPMLSIPQILAWADAQHERTGQWPTWNSGPVAEAPGHTWSAINQALKKGLRGLSPGRSLAKLFAIERGVRNQASVPKLARKQILSWADAYHRRTGRWPTNKSGSIPESPADTWWAIDAALHSGHRGLRPGSSLVAEAAPVTARLAHQGRATGRSPSVAE